MSKKIMNGLFSSVSDAELFSKTLGDNFMERPDGPENETDKFSDNGGDNALSRAEINESITSPATANEQQYRDALTHPDSTPKNNK